MSVDDNTGPIPTRERMTASEWMRVITYIICLITGAYVLIIGIRDANYEYIGLGLALMGSNALAGINVPGVTPRGRYAKR